MAPPLGQRRLFCSCGQDLPATAGLCRRCYRSRQHSRSCFDGNRETVLARDGGRCQACGSAKKLHVHHRQPGCNSPEVLVTVCAACHSRLHRLAAISRWIPEPLVGFWIEQHPGVPIQLQFPAA